MILLIDNYDSFTFNLFQYIRELTPKECRVFRNDVITLNEIEALCPEKIIISPGPCSPNEAGISLQTIKHFYKKLPILGVCLGHQAIAQVFGGSVSMTGNPVHGKTSKIIHNAKNLFKDIPNPFYATRYHSLAVKREHFPKEFEITAETEDNVIMGIKHKTFPLMGVQFHPESILTEYGKVLLGNFLKL